MARMAPAPDRRVAHRHETGDLINNIVLPLRFEGGAVAAFVPTRVTGRAIKYAVDDEKGHTPPCAPEICAERPGHDQRTDPDKRVARRRTVGTLHQLLHASSRNFGLVPFRIGQPDLFGTFIEGPFEAIVAWIGRTGGFEAHGSLSLAVQLRSGSRSRSLPRWWCLLSSLQTSSSHGSSPRSGRRP